MTAHLSESQARKLGLVKPPKVRTTRVAEPRAKARSTCSCGETFTTTAAEDRHVSAGHNRFASEITTSKP